MRNWIYQHPETLEGTVVGNGECVAFVRNCGVPASSTWQMGVKVRGSNIQKGTIIATFVNHVYPQTQPPDGKSMHAAVFDKQDSIGIWVWDQWVNQPVHYRQIKFMNGAGKRSNDGDAFSVVLTN